MKYTPEERRAYVRGVLSTCVSVRATMEVQMQVCKDLKILPEELDAFAEASKALCKEGTSFASGTLGVKV